MLERFTWYRQSAFRWQDDERTVYIDPWGTPGDAPPADRAGMSEAAGAGQRARLRTPPLV